MESQCFQRRKRKITSKVVLRRRMRVFIKGVMKLAMVDTKTSSTAIKAKMTLMNLPSRARALAFSTPSSCTTCCCCCCNSSLVTRVRQDSTASCSKKGGGNRSMLTMFFSIVYPHPAFPRGSIHRSPFSILPS